MNKEYVVTTKFSYSPERYFKSKKKAVKYFDKVFKGFKPKLIKITRKVLK